MGQFIKMQCPSCGGALEISQDMERFACGYCGTEQFVQRRGGTVTLKALTGAIEGVRIGTDKTAAELALRRLENERAVLIIKLENLEKVWTDRRNEKGRHYLIAAMVLGFIAAGVGNRIDALVSVLSFIGVIVITSFVYYSAADKLNEQKQTAVRPVQFQLDAVSRKIAATRKVVDS